MNCKEEDNFNKYFKMEIEDKKSIILDMFNGYKELSKGNTKQSLEMIEEVSFKWGITKEEPLFSITKHISDGNLGRAKNKLEIITSILIKNV